MNTATDPLKEYRRRLDLRRAETAAQDRVHARLAVLRLVLFLAAAVLAWFSLKSGRLSAWWLTLPAIFFVVSVILQERVQRRRRCTERAAAFYEQGIARLQNRWMGKGEQGSRFVDPDHPYAADLDLFGFGSLFELLCTARTCGGEQTLAAWLLHPADPTEIRHRQAAVDELRPGLRLREDLAVSGSEIRSGVDAEALAAWGAGKPILLSRALRVAIALIGLATVSGLVVWIVSGNSLWFAVPGAVAAAVALRFRPAVRRIIDTVERPGRDLALLSEVLARLEQESFRSARLIEIRRSLDADRRPPSIHIRRLNQLIVLLDSRRNQLFAVVAGPLLWGTQVALAIEAWRHANGSAVARWLAAVGEMEALCAFAGYAYEHPADPFPEIAEGEPRFEATGLAHPLLPEERCVRNDIALGPEMRLVVVSGSNMSGKSTLLRSIGTNAVLALAGAPVRAARLRVSPVAVGASIRITDSLQGGTSRFYAEITRLRQLVDITRGRRPLLFLLDELLQGTNSHDRRIGAEAVVRGLVQRGSIGLLTTHDLALAHIAEILAPAAANVHFEDHLQDGRIAFDYRLRPGVVQRSNALELMRSVGLEV